MKTAIAPRITQVERLTDGVIITFNDDKRALYPVRLLLEVFDKAQPLSEDPELTSFQDPS